MTAIDFRINCREADKINRLAPTDIDDYYACAVFVGQAICGLHHKGLRPNKLTRLHDELTTDYERRWERECLLPAMRKV